MTMMMRAAVIWPLFAVIWPLFAVICPLFAVIPRKSKLSYLQLFAVIWPLFAVIWPLFAVICLGEDLHMERLLSYTRTIIKVATCYLSNSLIIYNFQFGVHAGDFSSPK
jgi:hypothetical protein